MNQPPTYKIYGLQRRTLKKELAELKSYAHNFWYYHQLDKDMTEFYGKNGHYPMSDEKAQIKYEITLSKIKNLEELLSHPYNV